MTLRAVLVALLLAPAAAWAPASARAARRGCVTMKSKNPPTYKKKKAVNFGKGGWTIQPWAETAEGYLTESGVDSAGSVAAAPPASAIKPGAVASTPETMELLVKAGPAGDDVGDCPFAHCVRMVLEAKAIAHTCTPVAAAAKPAWLEGEFGGRTPVLVHDGEKYSESVEIAKYLDFFFRDPPLGQPNDNLLNDAKDFFPALKSYLLADGADANAVANAADGFDKACAKLDRALGRAGASGADGVTLADCVLAPQLYHARVALPKVRGVPGLDAKHAALASYSAATASIGAFTKTAPPEATVLWGWEQAAASQ